MTLQAVVWVPWFLFLISSSILAVRCTWRIRKKQFQSSEWTILAAQVLIIANTVCLTYFVEIDPSDNVNSGYLVGIKVFYISSIFYNLALWATKFSTCFYYNELLKSTTHITSLRVTYVILAITLIATLILVSCSCIPPSHFWTSTESLQTCSKSLILTVAYCSTALNVATYFILLYLPYPIIWHLRIKYKVALSLLFSLITVLIILSILRAVYLERFFSSIAIGQSTRIILIFTSLELNIGVIINCAPIIYSIGAWRYIKNRLKGKQVIEPVEFAEEPRSRVIRKDSLDA